MRIDSNGFAGIGTSTPQARLDVNGPQIIRGDGSGYILFAPKSGTSVFGANFDRFDIRVDAVNQETWIGNFNGGTGQARALSLYAANSERMRIDSSGNLLVGATSGNGRFHVRTAGNTGATWGAQIVNSDGTIMFAVLNNGNFYTGNGTFNRTTGAAANLVIENDNGVLARSTSSIKYKTDVQDATHGLAEVMALRPVTYKGKNDGDKVFGGLIAEEVHEAGLTEFVQYAEDGSPDALAYSNMVSLAFKAIQELKAELDTVKAELATLKGTQP
jgi:hypothetical protein